ncbi:condensation domain-containing protein [Streptomyces formicae]|uniref:Putative non-ribosomal peptide synthetase n=1 Tax=Streptomyces formicae TaxID=1616117 RepID=A0A291Q2P6_9ACTN|nr:condensation domain-containing protein [Streptomyces formicae]ATL25756.1 putative non-ribosomal peptide synthetase [Streptomyces formicae]
MTEATPRATHDTPGATHATHRAAQDTHATHRATYAQELLGLVESLLPGTVLQPGFLVRAAYRVSGTVDERVLRRALDDVVARHGALRTLLLRDGGALRQRVLPPMPSRLAVTRLGPGRSFDEWIAEVALRPHPCDEPPLLWADLGRKGDEAVLVLVAHHIAADAWSQDVLARDVVTAYSARLRGDPPLSADVMQYADIAAEDHGDKWQARIGQALPYWRDRLTAVEGLGLPAETPDAAPGPTAVHSFRIDSELRDAVRLTARHGRTTPFTLLLTAFVGALLPPGDALVPVITAGRIPSEWDTVGFLLNVLQIQIEHSGAHDPEALRELCPRVDRRCREAYANDIPLIRVLEQSPQLLELMTARDLVAPVFQVIVRSPVRPATRTPALALDRLTLDSQSALPMPLPFFWTMRWDDEPGGYITYDTHLFSTVWMERAVATYLDALTGLVR